MNPTQPSAGRRLLAGSLLLVCVAAGAGGLWLWRSAARSAAAAAAAHQPEPSEVIEAAAAAARPYVRTTTAIGTVRALQSVVLRNERAGTVQRVLLVPGQVVEAGALLLEFDTAVEAADRAALQAEAALAESLLGRLERALQNQGASAADVDRARAERDKALANVARTEAVIAQKRLTAPFRARVGLVDVHPGQYLEVGTAITTLQGVDAAVHVDFQVTQEVAARIEAGATVQVLAPGAAVAAPAVVVAADARVDERTRSAMLRALLRGAEPLPRPGTSVRVEVPVAPPREVVVVPVSALRRGPAGDAVYVLQTAADGALRAHQRPVRSGAVLGDEVVVEQGLAAGERVAAAGSFKLREGVLVQVAGGSPAQPR